MSIIFFWLLPIIIAFPLATSKKRSVAGWVLLAFFFSWFSTIVLVILPAPEKPEETKLCFACQSKIPMKATICAHCRSEQKGEEKTSGGKEETEVENKKPSQN